MILCSPRNKKNTGYIGLTWFLYKNRNQSHNFEYSFLKLLSFFLTTAIIGVSCGSERDILFEAFTVRIDSFLGAASTNPLKDSISRAITKTGITTFPPCS